MARILQLTGYAVRSIDGPFEVIARLRRSPRPTMLVIDMPPPDVELVELVRRLRATDRGLPIVVIVGDDGINGRRDVVPAADVLYVRPSELELIELVAQTLARYR